MTDRITTTPTPQPPDTQAAPLGARHGVLAFCCVLAMITYLDRVCFGTVAPYIQEEFKLTNSQLGLLFTAFALAYSLFEVPTGWLGDVFGARVTLIRIVVWWSAFTALTGLIYPQYTGYALAFYLLLSIRFFFGVGEAGAFPNISRAFAEWFPRTERGSAQGAVWMAGRFAGGISPLLVTALVYTTASSDPQPTHHWRHIFWIFGAIGVVWCVFFWFWFRDRPEDHSQVTQAELALIRAGRPVSHDADSHSNVPWGKLATSANLWILCLMYFGCAYGWYFNITYLPKYLKQAYDVDKDTAGFWTFSLMAGLPLLLGSTACLLGGLLTDWFIKRTGDRKWGRRLFGMIGHGLCAVCYFVALTADSAWSFVLLVAFAAFFNDLTMGAAWASCIDIGGRYSGIVSGCMNTIGNLGGAVAGVATGVALDYFKPADDGYNFGWTINFISYGIVYVMAVVMWSLFDANKPVIEE